MDNSMTNGIINIYDHKDGEIRLKLNNPPVNALSVQLVEELYNILSDINKNKNYKFLTIYGKGKHFSAGADLKERALMSDKETLEFLDKLNRCFDY